MTTLSETNGASVGEGASEDRAGWLELARQQSQALAESEAGRLRPWRWQAVSDQPRPRGRLFRWLVLRPSWAAVLLVLAFAGSVTLGAYVARRGASPPVKPTPRSAKQAPAARPAVLAPKTPASTEIEPAEIVEAREELAPDPKRPAARTRERPAPEEKIILGPDDTDGAGEMIIVPAPRTKRLPPLFTPEDYKKQGRRGTRF
jgi:hypothetical protein